MALAITSAVITNAGENMIAQVIAGSGAMTLTSVEFGSGFPASGDNIPNYTGLKVPVMAGQITGANNLVQSQTTIRVNVSSADAPITFQVNEIGVFAQLGATTPILFAYASTGGPTGDTVTPSAPSSAIIKDYALLILFTQNVPSATNVTLQQVVGLHAISHILPGGIDPMPLAQAANDGLTPQTPNDATQVLLGRSPAAFGQVPLASLTKPGGTLTLTGSRLDSWRGDGSWQPGLLVITSNITLFVSITGNDSTAQPNNPALPWVSLQGALNYLIPYFIFTGVIVTISEGPGVFSSGTINVNHPQGQSINIVGTLGVSATASSASGSSGVVTLNFATISGIAIGDYVSVICNTAGAPAKLISGVWKVTAVTGTSISYATLFVLPSLAGLSTILVQKISTIHSFNTGVYGLSIQGGGLGLAKNIILAGKSTGSTPIHAANAGFGALASFNAVGAIGWSDTTNASSAFFAINGGFINVTNCYANNNSQGFLSAGSASGILASNCIANVNSLDGFRANASSMTVDGCWAIGNATSGFNAIVGGDISLSSNNVADLNLRGLDIETNSTVGTGGINNVFLSNTGNDVFLLVGSVVLGQGGIAYSTTNVPINTVTTDGSYFSP